MSDQLDLDTPEESKPAAKKPARKSATKKPEKDYVIFRSRNEEPREFEVNKIRARRNVNHPGRCEWKVPAEKVEAFARHFHVLRGRILQTED